MEAEPNSRPHMWQATVRGLGGDFGLDAEGDDSPALVELRGGLAERARSAEDATGPPAPPTFGLQPRRCTSSLSGKNVRPQCGHGSNASWSQACIALLLYSALLMPAEMPGPVGTGFRSLAGFLISCASHFFAHCGRWMSMDAEPNSRPQM